MKIDSLVNSIPIINPNKTLTFILNIFAFIFNMIEFFYIPLKFTFSQEFQSANFFYFQTLIVSFLILERVFALNTGYYCKGILIKSRYEIRMNYFKNYFLIDAITLLPIFFIEVWNIDVFYHFKIMKLLFLLRMFYLDSLLRKIWDISARSETGNYLLNLIKLIIWIFLLAHLFACCMHELVASEDESIKMINLSSEYNSNNFYLDYLNFLYWAFATMLTIGYGDVTASTEKEKIFNIVTMLFTCCLFMTIMNQIGEIINDLKKRKEFVNNQIIVANKYLDAKTNDSSLKGRVNKYLEYVLKEKQRLIKEGREIVSTLSNSLKMEIFQIINSEIIERVSLLSKNFSSSFLCSLTTFMFETSYSPEDFILNVFFLLKKKFNFF